MKTFVIILDLILCCGLVYGTIAYYDTEDFVYNLIPIAFFILSILNIYCIKLKSNKPTKSWISLYFKRKALEEKNKIDKLTKE